MSTGQRRPQSMQDGPQIAAAGRRCGSCSLCCRLLDVPEAGKQPAQWCPHCRPGKGGCAIYSERPPNCRNYGCGWLTSSSFGDEWFPQRCGIVVDAHRLEDGATAMRFHVDPRTPNRWREEPYYSGIKDLALRGLRGDAGQYFTVICIGQQPWLLVLPHKEIEWSPGIAFPLGPDQFEFVRCEDADAVRELDGKLRAFQRAAAEVRQQHPGLPPLQVFEHTLRKLAQEMAP